MYTKTRRGLIYCVYICFLLMLLLGVCLFVLLHSFVSLMIMHVCLPGQLPANHVLLRSRVGQRYSCELPETPGVFVKQGKSPPDAEHDTEEKEAEERKRVLSVKRMLAPLNGSCLERVSAVLSCQSQYCICWYLLKGAWGSCFEHQLNNKRKACTHAFFSVSAA